MIIDHRWFLIYAEMERVIRQKPMALQALRTEVLMKTILLGAAGTGTSFAIASMLKSRWGKNIRLISTDIFDKHLVSTSILSDSFYKVPYANHADFASVVSNIMENEEVDVYIPILNDEIILGAQLIKQNTHANVDIWSSDLHAKCIDKAFADLWLNKIGVRTPRKYESDSLVNESSVWVCKPRNGFGSKNVKFLNKNELHLLSADEIAASIIQEVCTTPEVTVDSFYDHSKGIGFSYCRERLEIKSGVCTKARLFFDSELDQFSKKIGQALNQRGTICFQAMRSAEGWAVTDLNLRSGAGTAITCSAGFDVLSAGFACRTGADYISFLRPLKQLEEFYITRQYSEFIMQHTP
jgi:hypothetical protein